MPFPIFLPYLFVFNYLQDKPSFELSGKLADETNRVKGEARILNLNFIYPSMFRISRNEKHLFINSLVFMFNL